MQKQDLSFAADDMLFGNANVSSTKSQKQRVVTFWKNDKSPRQLKRDKTPIENRPAISMAEKVSLKLKKQAELKEKLIKQQSLNINSIEPNTTYDEKAVRKMKEQYIKQIQQLTKDLQQVTKERNDFKKQLNQLKKANSDLQIELSATKKFTNNIELKSKTDTSTNLEHKEQSTNLQKVLKENKQVKKKVKELESELVNMRSKNKQQRKSLNSVPSFEKLFEPKIKQKQIQHRRLSTSIAKEGKRHMSEIEILDEESAFDYETDQGEREPTNDKDVKSNDSDNIKSQNKLSSHTSPSDC